METEFTADTQKHSHFRARRSKDIHTQAAMLDTWHQEYSQISAGQFSGSVQSAEISGFRLFSEQMNRAVFQKGLVKSGGLGFGVIVNSKGHAMICGERAAKQNLIIFSGSEGFEFFSPEKFKFVGVEIQNRNEGTLHWQSMLSDLKEALDAGPRSLKLGDTEACSLSHSLLQALEILGNSKAKHNNLNALKRQVVGSLLDLVSASEQDQDAGSPSPSHYWSVICNIRDLVFGNPECPLSVAELALHLNLSTRSIQTACAQTLGISPKIFLRALRLSEVRREIVYSNTVSEAATRWGFWHFGHFSRDYRSMFGELPSATLARHN